MSQPLPLPPCAPQDLEWFLESRWLLSSVTLVPQSRTRRTSSVACPRLLKVFVQGEVEVSPACLGRLTSPGSLSELKSQVPLKSRVDFLGSRTVSQSCILRSIAE